MGKGKMLVPSCRAARASTHHQLKQVMLGNMHCYYYSEFTPNCHFKVQGWFWWALTVATPPYPIVCLVFGFFITNQIANCHNSLFLSSGNMH